MNQLHTYWKQLRRWIAVLPLLSMLVGLAIHNGFRHGDTAYIIGAVAAVGAVYAMAPFMQLLRATALAPVVLGLLYVAVPYVFGLAVLGAVPSGTDYIWLAGLGLVGIGHMALQGAYRPTGKHIQPASAFVARFGTDWACFTALASIIIGCLLLIWQVRNALWLVTAVGLFLGALVYIVIQLADTAEHSAAENAIATAGTIVDGLFFTIFTAYMLIGRQAPTVVAAAVTSVLTVGFLCVFFWFIAHPPQLAGKRH